MRSIGSPVIQAADLRSRVGSLQQFAGVRRLVLDDGPERGVAVLELSTGGGLDFWVMADRGLDIGMLRWQGMPVAWQSPQGFMHPALGHVEGDGGRGFGRLLSGFLCTCGLDGVRQPADGRPLHGRLAMVPARITTAAAVWNLPVPVLRVEGECVQYRQGAENLRLHRVIEAVVGGAELRLTDTVHNDGDQAQSHDLLYHFNLGYPAIGPGTTLEQGGTMRVGAIDLPDPAPPPAVLCFPSGGHAAPIVLTTPLADGTRLRMEMTVDTATLPWVQFWRDLRPGCGLLAIEPCASQWLPGGHSAPLPMLAPGESRQYQVHIGFQRLARID
ncbi:MAG: DUF4432 family protein [Burkholderiaceae bacterium]